MIQTNRLVAGSAKHFASRFEHLTLLFALWQTILLQNLLTRERPRNMCIREGHQAVRLEFHGLFDATGKAFHGLMRQAIQEVHIDTRTGFPENGHDIGYRHGRCLAMYCLQDLLVEVLNTEAETVEAGFDQGFPILFVHPTGMALDGDFRLLNGLESLQYMFVQGCQFGSRQEGRCTATVMDLGNLAVLPDKRKHQVDFLVQGGNVSFQRVVFGSGIRVASAVVAQSSAERDVEIEGQEFGLFFVGSKNSILVFLFAKVLVEEVGRWIARVARYRDIVFIDQLLH